MLASLIQAIGQGLRDVFFVWRREMRDVFRDQGVMIFFVFVPLLYPLLYYFIYSGEVVRDVPVVVVDEDRSALSREFVRRVEGTPDVNVVAHCADMDAAKRALRDHHAHGILLVPNEFGSILSNLGNWEQAHVAVYCDMGSLFYYKALYTAAVEVSLKMNSRIKVERQTAITTAREEEVMTSPIAYEHINLFNPQSGYASFLVPAILILILQQTMVLGVGMLVGTAVERNRFKQLIPDNRRYHGTIRIVLGKALCYFMIYALCTVWMLLCVPRMLHLPQLPDPFALFWFMLAFLSAITFFSMTVSVMVRQRELPLILFAFMSLPLLFLSGVTWPASAIPTFWKLVSYLFPTSFGIAGFVRINTMGAELEQVSFEYQVLWIQAGVFFITTYFIYRWQILSCQRRIAKRKDSPQA